MKNLLGEEVTPTPVLLEGKAPIASIVRGSQYIGSIKINGFNGTIFLHAEKGEIILNLTDRDITFSELERVVNEFKKTILATCDNCGESCSEYKKDSTLVCGSKLTERGEWMFKWGIDCTCGKKREEIERAKS